MPKPKTEKKETEVVPARQNDRRQRRAFTAEDKERILKEAAACNERGELAALLRREGIYSSHLTAWRAQMHREGVSGLAPKKPGPPPARDDKDRIIEKLLREKARLEKENRIQRSLLDLQRKAHEILGIALPRVEDESATDSDSSSSSDNAPRRSR